ncbi:MAG: hypothetical protein LCH46_15580 [Proteobacteria bacterium]|nr:hypothetical protein [Pseudomonadota bacterium]
MWKELLLVATVLAGAEPKALNGPEIIAAFDGHTISGAYADGTAFRETYLSGGRINYWDPRGDFTGTWSVTNNLFCTFYDQPGDSQGLVGGCFRVEMIGRNCFDFLVAAASSEEALDPKARPQYTARGSIDGAPSTCPDPLQV